MMRTSFVEPPIHDPVCIAGNTDLVSEGGVVVVKPWLGRVASQLDVGTSYSDCATHVLYQKFKKCLNKVRWQKHVRDHCAQIEVSVIHLPPWTYRILKNSMQTISCEISLVTAKHQACQMTQQKRTSSKENRTWNGPSGATTPHTDLK